MNRLHRSGNSPTFEDPSVTNSDESELSRRVRDNAFDLRAYLHNRDAACPSCGYNIRSLTTDRCSECGSYLTVAAVSQRRARPLPRHLKIALAFLLVIEISRVLWIAILHPQSAIPALVWTVVVVLLAALLCLMWVSTSADVSKKHAWPLRVFAALLWGLLVLDLCVIAAVYTSFP